MEIERKLQIKPGQSVAVVNAPAGSALATMVGDPDPSHADAIIGCAARRAELALLEAVFDAARADRLALMDVVNQIDGLGGRRTDEDDTFDELRRRRAARRAAQGVAARAAR